MTCGDGERTRSRTCTTGCSNIDENDITHSLTETEVCNQSACSTASCCDTITWTDGTGTVRTFTKGTQINEGYPVYENAADGQFMWWMWHGATGHWVINA